MVLRNEYLEDLKEQMNELPDSYFSGSGMKKERIFDDPGTMDALWTHFQKSVEEYGCDPDWSCKDALKEVLGIADSQIIYTLTDLNTHRSYPVLGWKTATLSAIWNSQKCWFTKGTTVEITAPDGRREIFVLE